MMIPTRQRSLVGRWRKRFADAFDGIAIALRDQESLWVQLCVAGLVILLSVFLQVQWWCWCAVLGCIAIVISLELMNTAIEQLVKTLHPDYDTGIAKVLHLAAGSVLVATIGSVIIGLIIFVPAVLRLLN